jgi:superfamily I DNA/RNA helicase
MLPTAQQQAIYDIVSGGRKLRPTETGNLAVDAVAGSGKTTTAVQAAKYAAKRYKRIGFTAFNRSIAEELQKKLEGNAEASTLHALGRKLVNGKFPHLEVDSDGKKYRDIAKREFPSFFESRGTRSYLKPHAASLFALINLIRNESIALGAVTEELIHSVCDAADIQGIQLPSKEYVTEVVGAAIRCLEIGSDMAATASMDFLDMIWLPVQLDLATGVYDLLFCDESQDFNRLQQKLILQASHGGHTVIVGDPFQSIMGWAGADSKSFRNLTKKLDAREMPLSVCWRCPVSHVQLAQKLVPHIQHSESAQYGTIGDTDPYSIPTKAKPGDLIICRNNAPLLSVAYNFLQKRIPVAIKGKNLGDDIIHLVKLLDPVDMSDMNRRLSRWHERETKKLLDRDAHESAFDALNDKFSCIRELASEVDTPCDLIDVCEKLFSDVDNKERVQLSSIHRAKGLESESVFLIRPELCCARASNEEAYQQEKNLLYVAITRAKSHLWVTGGGLCSPFEEWVAEVANRQMPKPRFGR